MRVPDKVDTASVSVQLVQNIDIVKNGKDHTALSYKGQKFQAVSSFQTQSFIQINTLSSVLLTALKDMDTAGSNHIFSERHQGAYIAP